MILGTGKKKVGLLKEKKIRGIRKFSIVCLLNIAFVIYLFIVKYDGDFFSKIIILDGAFFGINGVFEWWLKK